MKKYRPKNADFTADYLNCYKSFKKRKTFDSYLNNKNFIFLGYLAYIGYLMVEHPHANPILQVFVKLLLEIKEKRYRSQRDKDALPFEQEERKEYIVFKYTHAIVYMEDINA